MQQGPGLVNKKMKEAMYGVWRVYKKEGKGPIQSNPIQSSFPTPIFLDIAGRPSMGRRSGGGTYETSVLSVCLVVDVHTSSLHALPDWSIYCMHAGGFRRSSSSSYSAARRHHAPPPAAAAPPKPAPPPAPSSPAAAAAGTISDGCMWGFGSSIGHRIMDAVWGPRKFEVEHTTTTAHQQDPAACLVHALDFQDVCTAFSLFNLSRLFFIYIDRRAVIIICIVYDK